jgi:choline transporter-like protein 2/4/5
VRHLVEGLDEYAPPPASDWPLCLCAHHRTPFVLVVCSIQYTAIAGACADWYFTFEENGHRSVQRWAVERSAWRVVRYSFGSMIFGSLLIAVVAVFKWVATYFINQVMAQSPENKVIQVLGKCLICVVHCIEKFVRFLGKLAYIEVAIYGVNFCTGIYNASKRLLKNILRFAFLSVFAHLMVFLGKVAVIVLTVLICQTIMTEKRAEAGAAAAAQSETPVVPLICCGVAAGVTVFLFMSVYEIAIDTIMMCFLEDEAENDGNGKPSFASCVDDNVPRPASLPPSSLARCLLLRACV